MSAIIEISTAVPEFLIENEVFIKFYAEALQLKENDRAHHKLNFLSRKTKIKKRYSCLPDFKGESAELYTDGNYHQPVEKRMELFKKKIIPLATSAIDSLFQKTGITPDEVTHFITVSCTGLSAPGIEFRLAEHYGMQRAEKIALNFMGCYAAMKALKQAHYIAEAEPNSCVLIVCAELCSLHFDPKSSDEDIVANLLFGDGASAAMICGDNNPHVKDKTVLKINNLGSEYIPNAFDLMTWDITSGAFKMYLDKSIANTIRENILPVVNDFLKGQMSGIDFWAIHPGGVKIVEAVRDKLELPAESVADSMEIMQQYGNMSSPTILFILSRIFNNLRETKTNEQKTIFSCAFGPGINIEMIRMTSVNTALSTVPYTIEMDHAFEV